VNGRLIADKNKGITSILYTHLNQPYEINIAGKGKITLRVRQRGNKLKKVVLENDTLQFFTHEEGRARYDQTQTAAETKIFNYDYFLKDHLGNVRVVVTEEKDTSSYFATMELAARTKEEQLFSNITASVYPKSSVAGYPADATTNPNDYIVRLNGSGQKVGPTLVLKVMTGDKIDVAAKSFYKSPLSTPATSTPVGDILTSIATGLIGIAGDSKGTLGELTNSSSGPLLNAVNDFRTAHNPSQSNKPKAYLNWMLLDEQLKPVTTYPSSGAIPVGSADLLNTLAQTGITMPKSGYLCIYLSNESNGWDVYFDNLSVTHYIGPLVEETHYYPFGLTIPGISTNSIGKQKNTRKYQGYEHNGELDVNSYETFFRTHDPQIGRWWQVDPKPESSLSFSPYVSMNDNPISVTDPLGDVVRYEREKEAGVTRKELRELKREIRQMRRNSESFNKMYKDMKRSDKTFVYKASATVAGGHTAKPWDQGQDGVTTMSINVRMSHDKVVGTTAHETGHGWRIAHKLDVEPAQSDLPTIGVTTNLAEYTKQVDFVRGQNILTSTISREQAEVGAMHIGNIVTSELRSSGNSGYSGLQYETSYAGPMAVPGLSISGNPTYNLGYTDYSNKLPLSYYNNKIDIHSDHGVSPIR
jgi:RHS repeat-associated protein